MLPAYHYPILKVDSNYKRIECSNEVNFTPSMFTKPDKTAIEQLFANISGIKRRGGSTPISADPVKAGFMLKYQFVYKAPNCDAILVKRKRQAFKRGRDIQLWDIAKIHLNGQVECKRKTYTYKNGPSEWQYTSFNVWEFTDPSSYRSLHDLARRIELIEAACYPDEAAKRTASWLDDFLEQYEFVWVKGGDVRLVKYE